MKLQKSSRLAIFALGVGATFCLVWHNAQNITAQFAVKIVDGCQGFEALLCTIVEQAVDLAR